MIDMSDYDQIPLEELRKEEQELNEQIVWLREQEVEATEKLRQRGVAVGNRAYRRAKAGSEIGKFKRAIKNAEAQRRVADRHLERIRERIVELEVE